MGEEFEGHYTLSFIHRPFKLHVHNCNKKKESRMIGMGSYYDKWHEHHTEN